MDTPCKLMHMDLDVNGHFYNINLSFLDVATKLKLFTPTSIMWKFFVFCIYQKHAGGTKITFEKMALNIFKELFF